MPENVKDLVVRLSFEHGDTKNQIKAITNEIKTLDSDFKATAATAGGFSSALDQSRAKGAMLAQQIQLQRQAVEKYGAAIQQAQEKLQKSVTRHEDYGRKLEENRQKQQYLRTEIAAMKEALAAEAKASGDSSEAYNAKRAHLDELKMSLTDTREEEQKLQQAYARSENAINANDRAVQTLTNAQNEAKAALGGMERELGTISDRLRTNAQAWEDAAAKLESFGDKAKSAGEAQEKLGRDLSKISALLVGAGTAAVKAAMDWESAFAGVRKTVNGTDEELADIETQLLDMSEVMATDAEDLAGIAENAGQLGIATGNVTGFTKVMAMLSDTTNLTADEASSAFAQYANITGMAQDDFERLGSVTVELGNNLATTEADIVNMATRISAAGAQAGMTDAQIFALAGGLSSLGLEAEAGGTAFSKALSGMQVAVETGSEDLQKYADVAGMTTAEFAQAFSEDAAGTFIRFVQGLSSGTQSAIVMLDEMGISEVRMRDTLLRASNSGELLTNAVQMANAAWSENSALVNEANVRYQTTESRMTMLGNKVKRTAADFGGSLLPAVESGMDWISELVEKFGALDESQRQNIIKWGLIVAAVGPVISVVGKLNAGLGAAETGLSKFASQMASGGLSAGNLMRALNGLMGPMGIAALAAAVGVGAYKFIDWATGAKAAREATEALKQTAQEWQEVQASTFYDLGSGDPLARFGMSRSDFASASAETQNWLENLKTVWSDGEKETDEIVRSFADGFASASDDIRTSIDERGALLSGLGVLDPETEAKLAADKAQLDAWDKEIEDLLKKRQNGTLSEDDLARLDEVITLRAQLELEYGSGDTDGFQGILDGLQAEIDRMNSGGLEITPEAYGDALAGLAEGRSAYMETLDASYDAQHREIMAIEDETQRQAALNALNEEYQARRLEGENAYNAAVQEAAKGAWEANGFDEQMEQVDTLFQMLRDGASQTEILDFTQNMDEGKLAGMMTLIEQLKETGDESALADMGVDADDLYGKLSAIYNLTETGDLTPLNEMMQALADEVVRVSVDLDLTGAEETWTAFKETGSLGGIDVPTNLSPLEQTTVDAWNMAHAGLSLQAPPAKVALALGADWQTDLQTAFEQGKLKMWDGGGASIDVTPELVAQLTTEDIVAVDEDGTVHVIVTPETAAPVELSPEETAKQVLTQSTPYSFNSMETYGKISDINGQIEDLNRLREAAAEAQETVNGIDMLSIMSGDLTEDEQAALDAVEAYNFKLEEMQETAASLSEGDLAALAAEVTQLTEALANPDLDEDTRSLLTEQLQSIADFAANSDLLFGSGNDVCAGLADGMKAYGWQGDASTVASSLQGSVNSALGIASPSVKMKPTGRFVSAGIGAGMREYAFAADAAAISGAIERSFVGLPAKGRSIGANFADGLARGLRSRMGSTVSEAKKYAAEIEETFRRAWDIHSPSRVAENLTKLFGAGLEKGIETWPRVSEKLLEVEPAVAGRGQTVTQDNRSYTDSGTIVVQQMIIRENADIERVAKELDALKLRRNRGYGR